MVGDFPVQECPDNLAAVLRVVAPSFTEQRDDFQAAPALSVYRVRTWCGRRWCGVPHFSYQGSAVRAQAHQYGQGHA